MPGGPASGWITAGEHGRELIRVPAGSHVFSNPDSERMMATSSTGKIAVTLDGSGSDRLMQEIMRRIKLTMFDNGGSVQDVLGWRS